MNIEYPTSLQIFKIFNVEYFPPVSKTSTFLQNVYQVTLKTAAQVSKKVFFAQQGGEYRNVPFYQFYFSFLLTLDI